MDSSTRNVAMDGSDNSTSSSNSVDSVHNLGGMLGDDRTSVNFRPTSGIIPAATGGSSEDEHVPNRLPHHIPSLTSVVLSLSPPPSPPTAPSFTHPHIFPLSQLSEPRSPSTSHFPHFIVPPLVSSSSSTAKHRLKEDNQRLQGELKKLQSTYAKSREEMAAVQAELQSLRRLSRALALANANMKMKTKANTNTNTATVGKQGATSEGGEHATLKGGEDLTTKGENPANRARPPPPAESNVDMNVGGSRLFGRTKVVGSDVNGLWLGSSHSGQGGGDNRPWVERSAGLFPYPTLSATVRESTAIPTNLWSPPWARHRGSQLPLSPFIAQIRTPGNAGTFVTGQGLGPHAHPAFPAPSTHSHIPECEAKKTNAQGSLDSIIEVMKVMKEWMGKMEERQANMEKRSAHQGLRNLEPWKKVMTKLETLLGETREGARSETEDNPGLMDEGDFDGVPAFYEGDFDGAPALSEGDFDGVPALSEGDFDGVPALYGEWSVLNGRDEGDAMSLE